MAKYINQFTDSFKYLQQASKSVKDLSLQVNNVLNRLLPSRILSKANIFNLTIDVSQDLSHLIMLHVEDSLVENNILIAQKDISVRGLSTLTGHQPVRPISSTGILELKFKTSLQLVTPTILFNDAKFRCVNNNLIYSMVNELDPIDTSTEACYVQLIEGTFVTNKFIAQGEKLEKIYLDDIQPIENNYMFVYVNGILWQRADALYDMGSADKKYLIKSGIGNQVDIIFGDNVYGRRLLPGDVIVVKYLLTSGEQGNVENNALFTVVSGCYNTAGSQIDISDYVKMSIKQGFMLGSNGENIDATRLIAGWNSKAMTFTRPENLKAYLSRFSILSYVDVWTDQDDNIFKLLILPNVQQKLKTYRDYLSLTDNDLKLSESQKRALIENINESGLQTTSSELLLVEPLFEKYAIFVYINAVIANKQMLRLQIESVICETFLKSTFLDLDLTIQGVISQTDILSRIWSLDNVSSANIDIVSERNELARINGYYDYDKITFVGSVKNVTTLRKTVAFNENPNLGFDELGGISTVTQRGVPVIRPGFKRYNGPDSDPVVLEKPIYVFYKNVNNEYEEL